MGFKQFADDEVLTDTDLDRYLIQQISVIKTADESVISSTVLQPDDELILSPLIANSTYFLEFFLIYDAIQTADLKLGWSYPAGAAMHYSHGGLRGGTTATVDQISRTYFDETGFPWIGGPAAASGTNAVVMGEGTISTFAAGGDLTLRWSQNTNIATATVLKANSVLIAQKLTV